MLENGKVIRVHLEVDDETPGSTKPVMSVEETDSPEFLAAKQLLIDSLNQSKAIYDEFSKKVSPKFWRLTGTHFLDLEQMIKEVNQFEEITSEELSDPWIKKQLK